MKTAYLITARLKSTRLTKKLLREVAGRPIFAHMLDRVKQARRVDEIVVCTSTHPQDDELEALAAAEHVACFRGDEDDVLARLAAAAASHAADYILNITGDCPFVDPEYADRIVDAYERTGADLIRAFDLPHGAFSYGIKLSALQQVLAVKDTRETDSWGRYFTDTDLFQVHDLQVEPRHRRPSLRMTLDYPEDLAFFQAVFAGLYRPGAIFTLDEILDFLDEHPEVTDLNRGRGADWQANFAAQTAIHLKPRYAVRRAAIVGAGSIGKRHIRHLRALGITDIVALRTRRGQTQTLDPALGVREVEEWDELAAAAPDIAIVANPTSLHVDAAVRLAPFVRGLLIEKPVAASVAEAQRLATAVRSHRVVSFVGHTLQFHPAIRAIETALASGELGRPLALQAQAGQWLPDWQPEEDYRRAYSARADLGGGVIRTLIHELQLAVSLLGPAASVACVAGRSPRLEIDVESIADLMINHASGAVSQIHLDYLQRPMSRFGAVVCERGTVRYDLVASRVDVPGAAPLFDAPVDLNEVYRDELATFLRFVREGRVRHDHDVDHAIPALAIADAALASSEQRQFVTIT
jgi:spore coat polysaccharide biosynthesis protein SpsF